MKAHTDALKRRWSDPIYRDKQTAANRASAAQRKIDLASPLARAHHGQAVRVSWRMRRKKQ